MPKSLWASESVQATAIGVRRRYARMATMIITRTIARPTVTTVRIGLSVESSSEPARGSTVTTVVATTVMATMAGATTDVVVTMAGVITVVVVMAIAVAADLIVEDLTGADLDAGAPMVVVDSTEVMEAAVAVDSMAVVDSAEVMEATVAADSTVVVEATAADTTKSSLA
jgi:hypothetical protein